MQNKIKYNFNIREEIFGGTLLNLTTGKREFLSKEEMKDIVKYNKYPEDIIKNNKDINSKITLFESIDNKNNHFTFADIAYIELTRACNLRCTHCLNSSGKEIPNQLTFEEFKKIIIDFSKAGIQEIRFTGGEPLVFRKIYELIKIATDSGIFVSMGTNGVLITKEVAKKLEEAGLKKAVVSIDGTSKKHDEIRGKGTYQLAIEGLNNLSDLGIDTRINSVIMKSNMNDIINLAKKFHKEKISHFIRRFIESGRGAKTDNNVLSRLDYEYVKKQLELELNSAQYINGHYLRSNNEDINYRIKLPFLIVNGCKAGQRAIIITPEGDLHLCGFLAAQGFPPIDNVRKIKNWKEYWDKVCKKDYIRELRDKLNSYNSIFNIQPTNCLAYVQNYIVRGKE